MKLLGNQNPEVINGFFDKIAEVARKLELSLSEDWFDQLEDTDDLLLETCEECGLLVCQKLLLRKSKDSPDFLVTSIVDPELNLTLTDTKQFDSFKSQKLQLILVHATLKLIDLGSIQEVEQDNDWGD